MEPEHLTLPHEGAFRSRSRNDATLRLHYLERRLGHELEARVYIEWDRSRAEVRGSLAVVARLLTLAQLEPAGQPGFTAARA